MVIQQFYFEQRQSASPIESHATQPFISLGRLTNKATKAEKISAGDTMMLNTTKYTAMAVLGVGLAFAATPASACGAYGYAGSGYGSYGGCGAYGYAGYRRPYYGAYGYAGYHRPYYRAYGYAPIRSYGYGSYGGCGAYGYVPVRHYGGCGTYGYAGYHRPHYGAYGYASFFPRYRIYRPVYAFAGYMPRYRPFGYAAYGCGC
jgi:hypothetical protein